MPSITIPNWQGAALNSASSNSSLAQDMINSLLNGYTLMHKGTMSMDFYRDAAHTDLIGSVPVTGGSSGDQNLMDTINGLLGALDSWDITVEPPPNGG